jgi:ribosomal small subunit protein bTHX
LARRTPQVNLTGPARVRAHGTPPQPNEQMGKGDKKTKKGKRSRGSYGNARKKTKTRPKRTPPRKTPTRTR